MQSPTKLELFGENPFITDPVPGGSGPNGQTWPYNVQYFATIETAATVAKMLGGKVEELAAITPYGPFKQNMLNQMVRMPILKADSEALAKGEQDNRGYSIDPLGRLLYPGDIVVLFNGQSLEAIEQLVSFELGFEWKYKPVPAKPVPLPMVPANQLLAGPIGAVRVQADGSFWRHVKNAKGEL